MESFGAGYVGLPNKHDGGNSLVWIWRQREYLQDGYPIRCKKALIGASLTNEVESTLKDDITPIATKM